MSYTVADAEPFHRLDILADVREMDVEEWVLCSGQPMPILMETLFKDPNAIRRSILCGETGLCVAMWGAHPTGVPGVGMAWLVATKAAQKDGPAIHRMLRKAGEVERLQAHFKTLVAWAYDLNTLHHYWLRKVGFQFQGVGTLYPSLLPYHLYTRTAKEGTADV